ncbi:MAG TPA: hypothetical protein RMH99_20410 [Sandaracinaceae bacterium LLY-WYZ-13_1]|nr:hypothetical protein [Sandaracinaceae bacterium LLY-WYZ-13_1]
MSQGSGSGPRKGGFEGILGGLGDLLSALGDLAEKGEELKKSGVLDQAADGKDVKVHYGFSIRTAGQGGVEVEPFGNVRRTKRDDGTIETVVDETREPLVDVLE